MMFPLRITNNLQQHENGVWVLASCETFSDRKDNEAEEYIRACFDSVEDLSVDSVQLQQKIKDLNSEYHLSPARANLVRSIRLDGMKNVLELGSDCGATTRYLGEQGCVVEAVEVSSIRSELTRKRCQDLDNVHVLNADINALTIPDNQYDAIFLIGVHEHAAEMLPGNKNSLETLTSLLQIVQKALKPEGIMIIATDNRMGLKYWLGAGKDDSGEQDIGLYGYPVDDGKRTFDKREWESIAKNTVGNNYTFVYSFPDYKLPRVLLHEDFVAKDANAHSLLNRIPSSDPLTGWEAADDEFLRWKSLHQSGYLGEFANSFLIVLSSLDSAIQRAVPFDFVHFSSERRKVRFRTITEKLANTNTVAKKSINSSLEEKAGCSGCICQTVQDASYKTGVLLAILWLETCCRRNSESEFRELLQNYFTFVQKRFNETAKTDFLVDILPFNIVVSGHPHRYDVIDLEWGFSDHFDVDFVLFRAFLWFGYHNRFLLSRFNQDKSWQTVEDFIEYCFTLLSMQLQPRLDEFLRLEDQIHSEIAHNGLAFNSRTFFQTPLRAEMARITKPKNTSNTSEVHQGRKGLKSKIYKLTRRLYKIL